MITELAEVFFNTLLNYVRQWHPEAVQIIEYSEIMIPTYGSYNRDGVEIAFEDVYQNVQTMVYEGTFGDLFGELINE